MATIFQDLCAFFGISGAPENFAEFLPWFLQILVMMSIFLFLFNMIGAFLRSFNRGRF